MQPQATLVSASTVRLSKLMTGLYKITHGKLGALRLGHPAVFISHLFHRLLSLPSSVAKMNAKNETGALGEKRVDDGSPYIDPEDREAAATGQNALHRDLKGRHMQMIAM